MEEVCTSHHCQQTVVTNHPLLGQPGPLSGACSHEWWILVPLRVSQASPCTGDSIPRVPWMQASARCGLGNLIASHGQGLLLKEPP